MESPDGTRGLCWREDRWIPWSEIHMRQQTRGGPGGQHSNRSATAVELRWSVTNTHALSPPEKQRLLKEHISRLGNEGVLRILASEERSASRNRQSALERFKDWLSSSLKKKKKRTATRPTLSSKHRRLDDKKKRSRIKKDRGKFSRDGD
ncbi:MAG: aminoacyl-tRNA hydrolase [Planctomycetia bacterium]|jgi:ribosome-associated protein|nr:aminoacyl-tRNA hydrolase [Planctomycetia bacterium]NCG12894.1 aminoacyl-tRNA hydrolase [Planctomycetia bacterium]